MSGMAQSIRPSITNAPVSPASDRRERIVKYSWAMTIRFVCLVVFFLLPDWWRAVPAVGAVLLPYFAVVTANVSKYPIARRLNPVLRRELGPQASSTQSETPTDETRRDDPSHQEAAK